MNLNGDFNDLRNDLGLAPPTPMTPSAMGSSFWSPNIGKLSE